MQYFCQETTHLCQSLSNVYSEKFAEMSRNTLRKIESDRNNHNSSTTGSVTEEIECKKLQDEVKEKLFGYHDKVNNLVVKHTCKERSNNKSGSEDAQQLIQSISTVESNPAYVMNPYFNETFIESPDKGTDIQNGRVATSNTPINLNESLEEQLITANYNTLLSENLSLQSIICKYFQKINQIHDHRTKDLKNILENISIGQNLPLFKILENYNSKGNCGKILGKIEEVFRLSGTIREESACKLAGLGYKIDRELDGCLRDGV